MKPTPHPTRGSVEDSVPLDDIFPQEPSRWCDNDPETRAKEITAPVIQSLREELKKIDVSKFRQHG